MGIRNRLIVAGSLTADLVAQAEHLPKLGEPITSRAFHIFLRGKGANQSVAAARLEAQVFHGTCRHPVDVTKI